MIKEENIEIDFEILGVLANASSKKYLRKILEFCFLLRNKTKIMDEYLKTPVATQFCQDLELNEEKAHNV